MDYGNSLCQAPDHIVIIDFYKFAMSSGIVTKLHPTKIFIRFGWIFILVICFLAVTLNGLEATKPITAAE